MLTAADDTTTRGRKAAAVAGRVHAPATSATATAACQARLLVGPARLGRARRSAPLPSEPDRP